VGQLGQANIINLNLPTQVGTANNWLKIDAGNQHSLAIDNTGFVYGWGDNTFGQFGNGTNTASLIPFLISSSNNWAEVSAGFDHSMLLNTSGILYTAGNNTNGQLGDGTNTASNTMIPISFNLAGTVTQYIAISAGNSFSLAIKNDNTLWSGGFNSTGQLGLGNNTAVNVLNQVGTSNTWYLISAGDAHSLAMDNSTSLWSTGRNLEGALGIGNFTFSYNILQSVACPITPLGIEEVATNNIKPIVYPNPTNDTIKVDFTLENTSNVVIRITNIQGQLISELNMKNANGLQTATLNLSNQSKGIYFLTVTTEKESYSTKVLKE
jgi:alpha-tubulin suppressor-like RCC1 family protein